MRLNGTSGCIFIFCLPRKTISNHSQKIWLFYSCKPPKRSFSFLSKLWQEIHLFSKVIFIEFYGKPLNISSYGQNSLSLPFSCQFLFFYNWISLALLTDYSKIFHSLVPLFSILLNLLLKFSCSFFFLIWAKSKHLEFNQCVVLRDKRL